MSNAKLMQRSDCIHRLVLDGSTDGEKAAAAAAHRVHLRRVYRALPSDARSCFAETVITYLFHADRSNVRVHRTLARASYAGVRSFIYMAR